MMGGYACEPGKEGDRDELIPFAETIDDPEAFRMFLKNYVPGEVLVYEQIKLPLL